VSNDDKQNASEAWDEDEYPYWVATDQPNVMRCGKSYVQSSSFRWVVDSNYKEMADHLENVTAFYGQLEVRVKVMDGYIKFLEGLCRHQSIPLPTTYTLSLDNATQPPPQTSVDSK
jgi:hypothetical protein